MTPSLTLVTAPTWVIDPDDPAEVVRRIRWDRLMIEVLGLFPTRLDLTHVYRVLVLGCGAGEWTLAAVRSFPVSYLGLDVSPLPISSARAMAQAVGYDDLVRFAVGDLTDSLPFANASFDLVVLRFLGDSLPTMHWPRLLHEAWRVLTGSGIVLLSEAAWPSITSPAGQQLARLVTHARWKAGYGLSADGHHGQELSLSDALPMGVQQRGWSQGEHAIYPFPFSCACPMGKALVNHVLTTLHLMQPFLTRMGSGSQHELSALCEQVFAENQRGELTGSITITQAWAYKDQEED